MKRPRSVSSRNGVSHDVEVQLQLICEEEELSPAQINAYNIQMKTHKEAKEQVKTFKEQDHEVIYIGAGDPIPPPPLIPTRAVSNGVDKVISLDSDEEDDALIVMDPPKRDPPQSMLIRALQAPIVPIHPPPPPPPPPAPQAVAAEGSSPRQQPIPVMQPMLVTPQGQTFVMPQAGQQLVLTDNQFNQIMHLQKQGMLMQTTGNLPSLEQVTKPVHRVGEKRPRTHSTESSESQPKRGRKKLRDPKAMAKHQSTDTSWVPLDEYYYGKKEGDPTYHEKKGEYRFKCWYCHKMLYNNIRLMQHMQGHIDSEKQQNLDLADLTQCATCYKTFDTPFEMQCHTEKVHQKKSNVLVCRVCEKDHENQTALRHHMQTLHSACEMPYVCQLCNFRSSVYNDVVDHFKKRHDSSQHVMCLFCMSVMQVKFTASGCGNTLSFYHHLQKHNSKSTKRCSSCKLSFLSVQDLKKHKQKDHQPNYRVAIATSGKEKVTVDTDESQVMIQIPAANSSNGKVKSLNAPQTDRTQEFVVRWSKLRIQAAKCRECKQKMSAQGHFRKFTTCSLCRFATGCANAFATHMKRLHSGKHFVSRRQPKLQQPWFCLCGYKTDSGNRMANHLVRCCKRTSYMKKPEQKYFEYDDELEDMAGEEEAEESVELETKDSDSDSVPPMLRMLGLGKKHPSPARREASHCSDSSAQAANEAIETMLDCVFPAEAEATRFVSRLLASVDLEIRKKEKLQSGRKQTPKKPGRPKSAAPKPDAPKSDVLKPDVPKSDVPKAAVSKSVEYSNITIPPELKGSMKKLTVRITDAMKPSKKSISAKAAINDTSPESPAPAEKISTDTATSSTKSTANQNATPTESTKETSPESNKSPLREETSESNSIEVSPTPTSTHSAMENQSSEPETSQPNAEECRDTNVEKNTLNVDTNMDTLDVCTEANVDPKSISDKSVSDNNASADMSTGETETSKPSGEQSDILSSEFDKDTGIKKSDTQTGDSDKQSKSQVMSDADFEETDNAAEEFGSAVNFERIMATIASIVPGSDGHHSSTENINAEEGNHGDATEAVEAEDPVAEDIVSTQGAKEDSVDNAGVSSNAIEDVESGLSQAVAGATKDEGKECASEELDRTKGDGQVQDESEKEMEMQTTDQELVDKVQEENSKESDDVIKSIDDQIIDKVNASGEDTITNGVEIPEGNLVENAEKQIGNAATEDEIVRTEKDDEQVEENTQDIENDPETIDEGEKEVDFSDDKAEEPEKEPSSLIEKEGVESKEHSGTVQEEHTDLKEGKCETHREGTEEEIEKVEDTDTGLENVKTTITGSVPEDGEKSALEKDVMEDEVDTMEREVQDLEKEVEVIEQEMEEMKNEENANQGNDAAFHEVNSGEAQTSKNLGSSDSGPKNIPQTEMKQDSHSNLNPLKVASSPNGGKSCSAKQKSPHLTSPGSSSKSERRSDDYRSRDKRSDHYRDNRNRDYHRDRSDQRDRYDNRHDHRDRYHHSSSHGGRDRDRHRDRDRRDRDRDRYQDNRHRDRYYDNSNRDRHGSDYNRNYKGGY